MNLLIKNATILDPKSKRNGKSYDIHVSNGKINSIAKKISIPKAKIIEGENCYIGAGFLDIGTQIGEPGFEHRETISSISHAAAKGGYTGIAPFPNTSPTIDHAGQIAYILNKSEKELPDFFPIGSLSIGTKGKEISELIDMMKAGAAAFSDGMNPIASDKLLQLGLEYSKATNALIINMPLAKSILTDPQMHEGKVSTSLGLNGIPIIAETIMLHRDLQLQKYTGAKMLSYGISSEEGVIQFGQYRKQSKNLFASTAVLNIAFEDSALSGFDSNYKTIPPIRGASDQMALIDAINSGLIDCITTNHFGIEIELKSKSFANAAFGAATMEIAFSLANQVLGPEQIVKSMAINPRKILNLPVPEIKVGQKANFVVFDTEKKWMFNKDHIASKSNNYPMLNRELKGKVLATMCGKQYYLDEN